MSVLLFVLIGMALGLSLGLFGGGGGILAVPLLVVAGLPTDEAATTSLIVVTIGAIGGLISHAKAGRVDWRRGVIFGALGTVAAVMGSRLALASEDQVKLYLFAVVLVVVGALMLRKAFAQSSTDPDAAGSTKPWWAVVLVAAVVGLFTGFFGVGGGFLVVPALGLVLGMPLRIATATALLVIVINSVAAFIPRAGVALDWQAAGIVGVSVLLTSLVAARWSNRWSARALGVGFSVLVLVMAGVTVFEASQLP